MAPSPAREGPEEETTILWPATPKERSSVWPAVLTVVAVIAAEMAVMSWAGNRYRNTGVDYVGIAMLPVWLVFVCWLVWKFRWRAIPVFFLIMVLMCGGWGIVGVSHFTRPKAISAVCAIQLGAIGEELKAYYRKHGSFPPAYVADASGKPMHSWRVLILPFIEENKQYDFNEAWDGPHNRKVREEPTGMYRCPWDLTMCDSGTTSYLAVVGPHTAWPGPTGSKLEDFKDGPENTIMVVEVADSDIPWAKPYDLHVGQMPNSPGPPGPSSPHPRNGFLALFADGSVRYLRMDLDEATFWALLSRDGGEKVDLKQCSVVFPPDSS